jgi:predicted dehydrogenase
MIKLGVIGYGYWGPNIVRNFSRVEGVDIVSLSDIDPDVLNRAQRAYRHLKVCSDYRDITTSKEIDAVAIVTPVFTHFELAKSALENGKHIFVEKPFTSSVREAEKLIELADKKNLKIMIDHTFLFTGAVRKMKEVIDDNTLGDLYYYDSTRVNLGLFQHDVNVIWDLAPHDFSVMDFLVKEKPVAVVAHGIDHFNRGLENIAFVTVYFDSNMIAHFNVNWLSPVKIRTTLVGGDKKMIVWNDLAADEKIKIYDKGVDIKTREGVYNLLINYRSADMCAPRIENIEALKYETEYFIDCISSDKTMINDGHAGLRIVKMLEVSTRSLKDGGKLIKL